MAKLRHTGIVVTDIERSIRFYREYFGFEIQKDMVESGAYIDNFCSMKDVEIRTVKMVSENESMIELLYFVSHPQKKNNSQINDIGCSHIALTIKNLDDLYDIMKGDGIVFNCIPQISPDGLAKVTFCKDPDGTFIELVEEYN